MSGTGPQANAGGTVHDGASTDGGADLHRWDELNAAAMMSKLASGRAVVGQRTDLRPGANFR